MPTYFARGISVRLGAMPLEDTATQKIVLRKGDAAKQQSELAEKRLLTSGLLKEKQVPFPGDGDAFQLNWIANAPFMQTRVGSDVYDEEEAKVTKQVTTVTASLRKPKALALHVNLSDKTYVSGLYNQKTSLKVDVFFNGALSACLFIPIHDIKSGAKSNHQVFAGTRVDFLAERPWVILPPEVAADGNARKNNKPASVERQWHRLCQALQNEARERGTDEEGNMPPTAEFLSALATMEMPDQVRSMQKPGGKAFGVIDVVVTAGEGRKLTSGVGYLKAPKRMVDENYPFVLDTECIAVHLRADALGKSESEAEPSNAIQSSLEVIDVDAEGNSDPNYRSRTKRQALHSGMRLARDASPVLSSALPALGPLVPSILPPVQVEPRTTVFQASNIIGPDLASSPGFGRVDAQVSGEGRVYGPGADVVSRAGLTSKMVCPDLPPYLHTLHMRPSPHAVQFSDPTIGEDASGDLMRQVPFDNAGSTSSPLGRFSMPSQGPSYQSTQSFSIPMLRLQHGSSGFSPYAYSSPDQSHSGLPSTHYPRPNYNLSGMGPPLHGAPEFYKPDMLSQTPALPGPHDFRPQVGTFPPFDRRLSLPLPPTALYSVPTKPKRSLSPQKVSFSQQLKKAKSSIVIKRLVVYGQSRSILVDHRWAPAQRLDMPSDRVAQSRTLEKVALEDKQHISPVGQVEMFTDFRGSKKSTVQVNTPPPTSPSKLEGPNPTHEPEQIDKANLDVGQPGTDTSNQNLRVTKQRPLRLTTPNNNKPGIQGPMANPFRFEDPEEILREASARLRRSRSVVNQGNTPDPVVPPKTVVPAVRTFKAWETATSSPLSSLHTTPEPEMDPTSYTRSPQAPVKSSPAPVPQADDPSKHKALPKSCRSNQTSSPMKLAATFTTPQLPRHEPSTPQSSATKKRKNLHRTLPKEPRSPTRLKTNDNPSLNRDCVIAYAESKDKKNKQGILRQVKSERLGVFTESDVVFAARFFVEE